MQEAMVSIIITTFGRTYQAIQRSIRSALQQTYDNVEILLIDDNGVGSQLQIELATSIASVSGIRYLPMRSNSGAQLARNYGISMAKGEFVAFLDDDDEWVPEKTTLQMNKMTGPDIGLVFCKGYIDSGKGERVSYPTSKNFKSEVSFLDLLYADYIGTTTQALIRKSVFDQVGMFDPDQVARQDYELWIRISREYRCVGVNDYLFMHYMHDGVQISKSNDKAISGLNNIRSKFATDYDQHPVASLHISLMLLKLYVTQRNTREVLTTVFNILPTLIKSLLVDFPYLTKVVREHWGKKIPS